MTKTRVRTPERRSYDSMMRRCYRKSYDRWPDYGGRGVTVCERWRASFEAFLADMGPRPRGTTIDRKDNDGHYEPSNCKWSTPAEQNRNRRGLVVKEDLRTAIIALSTAGHSGRWIARTLDIAEPTVRNVINRVSWAPEQPENDNGRARRAS